METVSEMPIARNKKNKNLIDDFYKVTGATNCYTVSTCHEYLRSRWNSIFKNALTTTPLDWPITQIEWKGVAYPKTTSRHLERTTNKLLLNCNVELAQDAYKLWCTKYWVAVNRSNFSGRKD